jgi:hypothetical protein
MNLKIKSVAIGIIALFIGLAILPMSNANIIETEQTKIPVEIAFCQDNGVIKSEIIEINENDLSKLENFIEKFRNIKDKNILQDLIEDFLKFWSGSNFGKMITVQQIENLPGKPIFSSGRGDKIFSRYHGRLQIKRVFSAWNYNEGFGSTMIWGNGILMPPTQVLLMRQIGFMVGFVGLYIYIPSLMSGMSSRTFIMGSAMFAWGAAL